MRFPLHWFKIWELDAVSTCIPFWNLTPNYSELIISYFCLLSRLGEAAFIIIIIVIIRYKNNYTSTETYSTYNHRKTSPPTSQQFRFLTENRLLVFVQLWILCQTPTYFRISNREKMSFRRKTLWKCGIPMKIKQEHKLIKQGQHCTGSECPLTLLREFHTWWFCPPKVVANFL